jgi:mannitol-specific phosphotransferase system IIBC component
MKGITRIILGMMIISSLASSIIAITSKSQVSFATSSDVQSFMNMTEEEMLQAAKNMTQEEKQKVMNEFSKQNSTVDENMSATNK